MANRVVRRRGRIWVLLLALGLLGISAPTFAAVQWTADIEKAIQEAGRTGKPLLIKFSTEWCHYCVKMDRETFADLGVSKKVKSCFVPLKIDGDKHRDLVSQLGVRSFPTLMIVSPKQGLMGRIRGFRNAKQLRADLLTACPHADKADDGPLKSAVPPQPKKQKAKPQWKAVSSRSRLPGVDAKSASL